MEVDDDTVYHNMVRGAHLSLDEFIRKKRMEDQFNLILKPKHRPIIGKDSKAPLSLL